MGSKRENEIGPLDGCLGFLTIFDWITPLIQIFDSAGDVPKMLKGEPVDWFVQIHGADMPRAIVILQDHGVLSRGLFPNLDHMRKISRPAFYPANPWQGIRIPNEKFGDIVSEFEYAGIRYKY